MSVQEAVYLWSAAGFFVGYLSAREARGRYAADELPFALLMALGWPLLMAAVVARLPGRAVRKRLVAREERDRILSTPVEQIARETRP